MLNTSWTVDMFCDMMNCFVILWKEECLENLQNVEEGYKC